MSSAAAYDFFRAARVNKIMQELQPLQLIPQALKFLQRTAIVPADDGEIMARFTGRVQIADIVADDQQALVYNFGKFTYESTSIPNLKHGANLTQEIINKLASLGRAAIEDPEGILASWETRILSALNLGVQQRMEALIVAMHLDGFSYDRLGIIMNDVSWGMPADLKVTPSDPWTDATNGLPLTDIRNVRQIARERYGYDLNRVTMSTPAFNAMCATEQFKAEARTVYIGVSDNTTDAAIGAATERRRMEIARFLLDGVEIELYDTRYWSQAPNGVITSARFLPVGEVILTFTGDDNNPMVCDFANGEVTETKVAQMVGGGILGGSPGQTRGPLAYATLSNAQLNPPGITYWGVARGFPRKHVLQSSARITIGSPSDPIDGNEP